jgi:hypothetical protein
MKYLVLDLETLGVPNAADFIGTDDIEAPSNYVKQEAIDSYCAKERDKRIARAALDLDLARVCAIGMASPTMAPRAVTVTDEQSEARELEWLARDLDPFAHDFVTLVTFNGNRYDLPLLMRRAKYLGVKFPKINLDRYRSPHIDLYEELTMKGALKAHGLRWYMRRHGWTDLLDADPLKDGGADVAQACAEGRWEDIAAHVQVDVQGTLRLAQWLGLVPATVAQPETAGAF